MKKISASEKRLRDELCNWRESHLRLERQLEKEKQVNERNIDDLRWQNECLSKQVSALQGTLDLYIPFKSLSEEQDRTICRLQRVLEQVKKDDLPF